ncbi:MAG: hypothetical protein J4G17_01535 [Anaerolineae bacterium]|nr:hypothetical protein [Anaerolineae bacterium]
MKGVWWLPENPDHEITGILTFDPQGNSELELFGSYKKGLSELPMNQPIILGAGENGKAITLVDCIDLGTGRTVSQFQWVKSRYIPYLIIQGHHFNSVEEVSFERVKVSFCGFTEWASTGKGWGNIRAEDRLPVNPPDSDIFAELVDSTLVFRRGFSWSLRRFKEFSIREDAHVDFVADRPWGYEETIARIFHLGVFLSLAMKACSWPVSVNAPNPSGPRWELSIHYHCVTDIQISESVSRYFMYFALDDKREDIEQRLKNWFAISEILQQVVYLFSRGISEKMYPEDRFLTFAKAVEAYHRQIHEETYIDESEFDALKDDLKKSIRSCIPSAEYKDLRRRIYESLNLANNPSLHDRLAELREKHQNHNRKLFEDFGSFSDDVVSTRDYLTHYFDAGESKARVDGSSLHYMSEKLRLILDLCLLSELGFSDEELQQMAVKNIPPDPGRPESTAPQPVQSGG